MISQIQSQLKPITSEQQYREYLKIIDSIIDCAAQSPEEALLEYVSDLVSDYEDIHYSIGF